jgi:hypothetical protein
MKRLVTRLNASSEKLVVAPMAKLHPDRPQRGEVLLACIYDDVDSRLNPDNEECWHCGGEGETYDCFDGCCVDAESGCPDCARPCLECKLYARRRARAIREEVIKSDDVDIARAWLKEQGRLRADVTDDMIREQLIAAKSAIEKTAEPTSQQFGDVSKGGVA